MHKAQARLGGQITHLLSKNLTTYSKAVIDLYVCKTNSLIIMKFNNDPNKIRFYESKPRSYAAKNERLVFAISGFPNFWTSKIY